MIASRRLAFFLTLAAFGLQGVLLSAAGRDLFTATTRTSEWPDDMPERVSLDGSGSEGLTLFVDRAFPAGVRQIAATGKVGLVVADGVEIADGIVVTLEPQSTLTLCAARQAVTLAGSGEVVFAPEEGRELVLDRDNQGFSGNFSVGRGTVRMANAHCFGKWWESRNVVVKSGATLDKNGVSGWVGVPTYSIALEAGARFVNTGDAGLGHYSVMLMWNLTLRGDAEIATDTVIGGGTMSNACIMNINLDKHTLTKRGSGEMFYSCASIKGTGTIDVREGSFVLTHSWLNEQPSFPGGTLRVRSGALLVLEHFKSDPSFTVKNLAMDGSVSVGPDGVLTVTGSLSGTGTLPSVTLGREATLNLAGEGCLAFAGPLRFDGDDALRIDLAAVDLEKARRLPVLRTMNAADLPSPDRLAGIPTGWQLVKASPETGYDLVKRALVVTVR